MRPVSGSTPRPTTQRVEHRPTSQPQPSATPARSQPAPRRDEFRPSTQVRTGVDLQGGARTGGTPPATSLLTEDRRDRSVNCLDAAADYLEMLPPQQRRRSEVVFLSDTRGGAEGQSGHVLIRQGERYYDPASRSWHDSLRSFDPQGHYRQAGTLNGHTVHQILDTPPGSPERAAALQRANVPTALGRMMVADTNTTQPTLTSLVDAARGASDRLRTLDEQLGRQLSHYGPAMTPEQQQAFIREFQAANPEYQQLQQAQRALGEHLTANYDSLRERALNDPAAARELAEAMEQVAGTEHQAAVTRMLEDRELSQAMLDAVGEQSFNERLLSPAVEQMSADALAAINGQNPDPSALEPINQLLSTVGTLPQLQDEVASAREAMQGIQDALRLPDAQARMSRLAEVGARLNSTDLADAPNPLVRTLKGLNFGLGVLTAAEGLAGGDRDRALQGFLQAGQNADGLAYGLDMLSRSLGRMSSLGNAAQAVARVAPIISAVANGIDFLTRVGQINSTGQGIQALGSLASFAGSAMMLFPVTAPVGAIVTAFGTAASVLGNVWEGVENHQRNQHYDAQARELLARIQPPLSQGVIQALAGMDTATVRALAEQGGFTPSDFQAVAQAFPAFMSAVQAGGAGAVQGFFNGVGSQGMNAVYGIFNRVPPQSVGDWQALFTRLGEANVQSREDFRRFIESEGLISPEALQRARETSVPDGQASYSSYLALIGSLLGFM